MSMSEERVRKKAGRILPVLILIIAVLPAIFFMHMDSYRTGDEIVSYGMANEPEQGWMFSKGRIRSYVDSSILQDGLTGLPGRLFSAVGDVIKNRGNAAFFRTERPSETGWYSGDGIRGYLWIRPGEAFRFGDIYLNAMGDDANSFLYYSCLHLVSSIFRGISGTKWSGFLLNLICMAACLIILYRISGYFTGSRVGRMLLPFFYACSTGAIAMFTNIRPYALAVVLQESLLLVHLHMLRDLDAEGPSVAGKRLKWLLLLYILGYTAHYTTGIWAVCLAGYTICRSFHKKEFLRRYLLTGILAVFLGICVDPMSVFGLFSKQGSSADAGLAAAFAELLKVLVHDVCGNVFFLLIPACFLFLALLRFLKKKERKADRNALLFAGLLLAYMFLSTFLMHVVKVSTMIPMLFLLLALPAVYALEDKVLWKRLLTALLLVIWMAGSFAGLAEEKKNEYMVSRTLEEKMAAYPADTMVFVRDHGSGYDKIPLLDPYAQVYLLTTDEGWEQHREELVNASLQSGLVLLDAGKETADTIASWLEEAGSEAEILYRDGQCALLRTK